MTPIHCQNKLRERKNKGFLRNRYIQQNLIDFASNDYLGLARSSKLHTLVRQASKKYSSSLNGLGSTGSFLLTGYTSYAEEVEKKIAEFHGYQASLLFSCGYMANLGLLSSIAEKKDVFFFDTQVHPSIRKGIQLSPASAFPCRHNDLKHLEWRLKNTRSTGNRFICIESIYSTDGSCAPLPQILQLSKKYQAFLIVDEAHALGVYGPQGKGLVAHHNLTSDIFAQIVTFGKGLGTYGAAVLGSFVLKDFLMNFSTAYIYTTALLFYALAAIDSAYYLLPHLDEKRSHLHQLIEMFGKKKWTSSTTHIQPIFIKNHIHIRDIIHTFAAKNLDVRALMSPTVSQKKTILRLCLHAFNKKKELSTLIETIESCRGVLDV